MLLHASSGTAAAAAEPAGADSALHTHLHARARNAAALWTLDGSLEVARAGATGVNLHQGAGQNLYAAVIRWVDSANKLQPAMLRPAFYGMMMLQQALRGGSRLLGQQTVFASSPNAYKWIKVRAALMARPVRAAASVPAERLLTQTAFRCMHCVAAHGRCTRWKTSTPRSSGDNPSSCVRCLTAHAA